VSRPSVTCGTAVRSNRMPIRFCFLWEGKDARDADEMRSVSWRVAKNRDGMRNRGELRFFAKRARFEESNLQEAAA
jgi:hypothetical protein